MIRCDRMVLRIMMLYLLDMLVIQISSYNWLKLLRKPSQVTRFADSVGLFFNLLHSLDCDPVIGDNGHVVSELASDPPFFSMYQKS